MQYYLGMTSVGLVSVYKNLARVVLAHKRWTLPSFYNLTSQRLILYVLLRSRDRGRW